MLRQLRLTDPSAPLRPHYAELIQLDRRLSALSLSDDPRDAALIATSLDYVAQLVREIDRIRPLGRKCPLPWESDS